MQGIRLTLARAGWVPAARVVSSGHQEPVIGSPDIAGSAPLPPVKRTLTPGPQTYKHPEFIKGRIAMLWGGESPPAPSPQSLGGAARGLPAEMRLRQWLWKDDTRWRCGAGAKGRRPLPDSYSECSQGAHNCGRDRKEEGGEYLCSLRDLGGCPSLRDRGPLPARLLHTGVIRRSRVGVTHLSWHCPGVL